jgi:RND family efflux transporter MFP subunit
MKMHPMHLAAALVAAGIAGCSQSPGGGHGRGGRPGAGTVAVEVSPVETGTIRDVGTFTGSIVARSHYVVAPKVAGRLKRLTVDIGDGVRRGQLIAELDDDEYAQALEQAKAELAVAKANVAQAASSLHTARRELERVEKLRGKKIASESELDVARSGHDSAAARREVALAEVTRREAALGAAEVRLSYTRIRASWEDGAGASSAERVVGERFVHEGAMLGAGSPIVSVLDLVTVKAVVHVVERDYSRLGVGHPAVVKVDAFPDREFPGKVVRVAPLLKESSRQARMEVEVPNADGSLKPGMFARVRVIFGVHERATVVPTDALARRGAGRGVFVLDEAGGKVNFVPVTVGMIEGARAEIVEPKLAGAVVTLGLHLLEDGSAVIIPKADDAPPPAPESGGRKPGTGAHE